MVFAQYRIICRAAKARTKNKEDKKEQLMKKPAAATTGKKKIEKEKEDTAGFFFLIAGCNGSLGYWQSLATRE